MKLALGELTQDFIMFNYIGRATTRAFAAPKRTKVIIYDVRCNPYTNDLRFYITPFLEYLKGSTIFKTKNPRNYMRDVPIHYLKLVMPEDHFDFFEDKKVKYRLENVDGKTIIKVPTEKGFLPYERKPPQGATAWNVATSYWDLANSAG